VALLADHYAEDWTALWWARADGRAELLAPSHARALELLSAKYPQYAAAPPAGPVVSITVTGWSGWSAAGA
jgi:PPOX class probable F420-dependent enzyme